MSPNSTSPTTMFPNADGLYDVDGDLLIAIDSIAELDAIRHDLDGNGTFTVNKASCLSVFWVCYLASMHL